MGSKEKVKEAKEAFLLLCAQYEALGKYVRAEQMAKDALDFKAAEAVKVKAVEQFMEIGEQMKVLGFALDRLGGDSVMMSPEEAENVRPTWHGGPVQ